MAAMKMAGTVSPETSPERKVLDVNKYATKKTIAQGMLDIALLTANASQLKYILQVGPQHQFYSLMLGLITTSLILQVIVGVLFLIIGGLDIKKCAEQKICLILNDVILLLVFLISLDNVVISSFGMEYTNNQMRLLNDKLPVSVAVLNLVLSRLDVVKEEHGALSSVLNHVATGCAMFCMVSDVVTQAVAGAYLGTAFNINKTHHHINANLLNNMILVSNVVVVALNAIISAFNIKDIDDKLITSMSKLNDSFFE